MVNLEGSKEDMIKIVEEYDKKGSCYEMTLTDRETNKTEPNTYCLRKSQPSRGR